MDFFDDDQSPFGNPMGCGFSKEFSLPGRGGRGNSRGRGGRGNSRGRGGRGTRIGRGSHSHTAPKQSVSNGKVSAPSDKSNVYNQNRKNENKNTPSGFSVARGGLTNPPHRRTNRKPVKTFHATDIRYYPFLSIHFENNQTPAPLKTNYRTRGQKETKVCGTTRTKDLLEKMLSDTYQGNIALQLLDPKIQMKVFLDNVAYQDLPVVKLIMSVVIKASKNSLMENNFREFLKLIIDSHFVSKRLDNLINIEMHYNLNTEILYLLILFLKLLFEILPGIAYDPIYPRVLNLSSTVDKIRLKSSEIGEESFAEFDELKVLADKSCPYLKEEKQRKIKPFLCDYLEPPNNYRQISIYPTNEDLDIKSKNVFLRRNKTFGAYSTVDEYLDVQFRLMREDFLQPLREGLAQLQKGCGNVRLEIRLYHSVFVWNSLPAERMGIIYNIKFDNTRLKRVNWIHSKRFLYGSLLCLSDDNFVTFLFATVANREIKDLEKGYVTIKFHDSLPVKNRKYVMIETLNMFESYKHVLLKLQETNEKNLCLQKNLVFADKKINLPGYLSRNDGLKYTISDSTFFPGLNDSQWPSAKELNFDESQYEAFKTALTKEIAIIQGPPGTGKTYLGLKICSILIQNVQKNLVRFGPILVVCYTNHALDQFLEGILEFTNSVIRIGGRSKSEHLQDYSLLNWKKNRRFDEISRRKGFIFGQMRQKSTELIDIQTEVMLAYETVISLNMLGGIIDSNHYSVLDAIGIKQWLNGHCFSEEFPKHENDLNNIIERILFEEIMNNINGIVIEAFANENEYIDDYYMEDEDLEVNFINNSRRLDIDEDVFNNVNEESKSRAKKITEKALDNYMSSMEDDGFQIVKSKGTRKLFLRRLRSEEMMDPNEVNSIKDICTLTIDDRWNLYRYWRSRYIEIQNIKSKECENIYENLSKQLNEIYFEEDRLIMMNKAIIGMTTTGAARYGKVLAQIQCKIIIVEEAAEVLESHIVASLNPGCEHLILIGDHKQLKPNPAVYELARHYQLDLSLFERLINNNLHFNTLELQHRMRPEISETMKFIYPNLQNHPSVLNYPNVPAVSKNIFFFDHTQNESRNDETSSYSNHFEAKFIVEFCHHLMKNGIEKSSITILTLYSGQLFLLRSIMPKKTFEGVRVCVTDNYQGEENDIILLSLVRSNEEDRIGFLNIENRICVCLSRAKIGLFVFGNFKLLSNKNYLWKDICLDLRDRQLLGDTLVLLCQNHPEKRLEVKHPDDFKRYPEGGCEEFCLQKLPCGHICPKLCHSMDKNNQEYHCLESCTKLCPNGHRCNLKCWQTCKHCLFQVEKIIPICEHVQLMDCYKDPEPQMCKTNVMKTSPNCGHEREYKCGDTVLRCNNKCSSILDCKHLCKGTCWSCNAGRLHIACSSKCKKQLTCGHICQAKCSEYCPPCSFKCEEQCIHKICTRNCGDECIPCMKKCKWKCKHKQCTKQCHEKCDRDICNEHCKEYMNCTKCKRKFQCYGVCGEYCRTICLKCDPQVKANFFGSEEKEDAMFITLLTCGHTFECRSMDQYMNLSADNQEIVFKRCPKCKKVINKRSCFRYLNIVRNIHQDIKHVQSLNCNIKDEDTTEYIKFITILDTRLSKINCIFREFKLFNYFYKFKESKPSSKYNISRYRMSWELICQIFDVLFEKYKGFNLNNDLDLNHVRDSLIKLVGWLYPTQRTFSSFEMNQFYSEFDRIKFILQLATARKMELVLPEYPNFMDELKQCGCFGGKKGDELSRKWNAYVTENGYLSLVVETTRERKDIVRSGIGRWFKCSNGHYYMIEEYEAADQVTKCPDCLCRAK